MTDLLAFYSSVVAKMTKQEIILPKSKEVIRWNNERKARYVL
jgi:hypothetical protein